MKQPPRDLKLFIWKARRREPRDEPLTEVQLDGIRQAVKMTPERYSYLRETFPKQFEKIHQWRAAWVRWRDEHGHPPPKGINPITGADYTGHIERLRFHQKVVKPLVRKIQKRPEAQREKLLAQLRSIRRWRASYKTADNLNEQYDEIITKLWLVMLVESGTAQPGELDRLLKQTGITRLKWTSKTRQRKAKDTKM
jgi:hypothetical protein